MVSVDFDGAGLARRWEAAVNEPPREGRILRSVLTCGVFFYSVTANAYSRKKGAPDLVGVVEPAHAVRAHAPERELRGLGLQCPHRMACAKCSFYTAKGSTMAALLEGKNNLLRMRQEIPLSDAELAALDDGVSALESLLSRLADVPTPAGPTPLQLRDTALIQIEAAD